MTRASDADRNTIQAQLGAHCLAGRISVEELERRVGLAMRAETIPQLRGLVADLPQVRARDRAEAGALSETITIGPHISEPAGINAYLAAEQLPDGSVGLGIGGMKAPLPSCISPTLMKVQPIDTPAPSVKKRESSHPKIGPVRLLERRRVH